MPRKRQSTKGRIIKAAWNLFYKKGYDKTSVEDIINASKTSKGTFYHYFKGKEALLNSLSYLLDEKYEELSLTMSADLSAYDKLLYLNHELFCLIESSIDIELLAYLYSSQLITKDNVSLCDENRFYHRWLTDIFQNALDTKEFQNTCDAKELMHIYAMFERAIIYDWVLFKGSFSLSALSDKLLPALLDNFVKGV